METKSAIYTTEFWLTIAVQVISMLNLIGVWNYMPNRYAAFVMAFVQGLYTLSRGWAKSGVQADPNLAANYRLIPRSSDGVTRR